MARLTLDDLFRLAVPADPQARPDGGAVAYTLTTARREPDENRAEIWLAVPGAEPRRLAEGACPRRSPDGRVPAYPRPVEGRPQVNLLPTDGREPRVLTPAPPGPGPPAGSPGGERSP